MLVREGREGVSSVQVSHGDEHKMEVTRDESSDMLLCLCECVCVFDGGCFC